MTTEQAIWRTRVGTLVAHKFASDLAQKSACGKVHLASTLSRTEPTSRCKECEAK